MTEPPDLWNPYVPQGATLPTERLFVLSGLESPQLGNRRDIFLYLSPSLDSTPGKPRVIYAHDGQNLFDHEGSYAGSWHGSQAVDKAAQDGRQVILVGITNQGRARSFEYTPWSPRDPVGSGGERYLAFLTETVIPRIENDWNLAVSAHQRGVLGSSLGGLISLYAYFARPDVFGLCGALSPSLQVVPAKLFAFIQDSSRDRGRIYLDVGTREVSRPRKNFNSRHYGANATKLRNLLRKLGYRSGSSLRFVRAKRAVHHESAWALRLPGALDFLTT